jgi:hypothetical protein
MAYSELIGDFEDVFGGIDLPACISICDTEGLLIYSVGACENQWILESLYSSLVKSFESTQEQLNLTNESLDSLLITTGSKVYYIDEISHEFELYMIIQTDPELMNKVLPFLKSLVMIIERTLKRKKL